MTDRASTNTERWQQVTDAYMSRDDARMLSFCSDDMVCHLPGDNRMTGTYVGKDQITEMVVKLAELSNNTFKIDPIKILAGDRFGMCFVRATAERDGQQLDVQLAEGMEIGDDGMFTQWWFLPDDQAAWDAFWS